MLNRELKFKPLLCIFLILAGLIILYSLFALFVELKTDSQALASQLPTYLIIVSLAAFMFVFARRLYGSRRLQYSDKIVEDRLFYEIISDIIYQARLHSGNEALDMIKKINGLEIEEKTGRVLNIKGNPEKIIALLVSNYEKRFEKKLVLSSQGFKQSKQVSLKHSLNKFKEYLKSN